MAGEVVATESPRESKQVDQSLLTVLIAFLANVLIAIAKSVAAVITSSASMVAEAAHSPRLVMAMTEVQGEMSELIGRIAHPDEVLMRSNAQHRRIVELIRRRDAGRAVRLMREHVGGTEHILVGLLRP